jgi:hypothetical protein
MEMKMNNVCEVFVFIYDFKKDNTESILRVANTIGQLKLSDDSSEITGNVEISADGENPVAEFILGFSKEVWAANKGFCRVAGKLIHHKHQ